MKAPVETDTDLRGHVISSMNPQAKRVLTHWPLAFFIVLASWGIINIVQSNLTEIADDEAYYWMYSNHLDWGYFDHPPMIALFIKAGTLLFQDELGVRCVVVMAQLITLLITWNLVSEKTPTTKNVLLFFGIAASIVMFQVYGFIATPDAPLLLFTSLFLVAYKRFLDKQNSISVIFLAMVMAGLLYSKYHGILIIIFTLLSNPRLLWNRFFWLSGILAVLFYLPHINWQIQNDFASLQYHLVSRSRDLSWINVINYWPNQFFSFNPFFLGTILFLLFRYKPEDRFERALYFISWGFLGIFFLTSFRGHVEPHWTISASIPMMIIVYNKCRKSIPVKKYVSWVLIPSIIILVILRISLIIDFLPVNAKVHGRKENSEYLGTLAGNAPVIFYNSYQKPSVYTFYTGKPATTLNGFHNRKNQYDLWQFERAFFGQEAVFITEGWDAIGTPFELPDGKTNYLYHTHHFFTPQRLEVTSLSRLPQIMHAGDSINLDIDLYNPYTFPVRFNDPEYPVLFQPVFYKNKRVKFVALAGVSSTLTEILPGEKKKLTLKFVVPEMIADNYSFGIGLKAGPLHMSRNSEFIPVKVLPFILK